MRRGPFRSAISIAILSAVFAPAAHAQGARGQGRAPVTAKASAPIDVTGYWTAVLTEDWHVRMLTADKGDFGSGPPGAVAQIVTGKIGTGANPAKDGNIPYNIKGAEAALAWDPAKDEAAGNQCKAYGAPGVMRQPTHLHITWADDNTLKVDADFGTQTRLLHFAPQPDAQPSLQGRSVASWIIMGGGGGEANFQKGGALKVVTDRLTPGYYWKNGMPYTGNAVLKESFFLLDIPDNGGTWMTMTQLVEDPEYLTEPYVVNYHFKKLPDGSKWHPTPCVVR